MGTKKTIEILGVNVSIISLTELLQSVNSSIQMNSKSIISYVNVHGVNLAYTDEIFRNCLNSSNIVFCDGFGVKIAIKLITGITISRFTPPDWFDQLAEQSVEFGHSLYFLGSKQSIVDEAANIFNSRFSGIDIAGSHHGYFDKTYGSLENNEVICEINKHHPDILLVGFGMPIQEKWIFENLPNLDVKVIIPVGAFFDYAANAIPRAPRWMTDHGLEWLGRLIIEPKRLWKRYLIGNPVFFWRIIKHQILRIPLPY
jgi:N-acetylglucosaminyldiphosphoundecaprenol N-acetyl-beta-D-mannosaminyltransferase